MIVVLGSQEESMVASVISELQRRGAPLLWLDNGHLPASVRLRYGVDTPIGFRVDGSWVDLPPEASIYHRLGFGDFESAEDFSDAEKRFVAQECAIALQTALDYHPGRVVNPPHCSASNASKPFQLGLFADYGFRIPETLITNNPEAAAAFYEALEGKVVYKSISYLRSIVQPMKAADLQRLDTVAACPVQLQEAIEGFDVRVHVVGDRCFASRIKADSSDYRYDKQVEVVAWNLPEPWGESCQKLARTLGLALAGIDLRFTPGGEVVCFEANPSPAFSWYESRTGQPITAALCDLLATPL